MPKLVYIIFISLAIFTSCQKIDHVNSKTSVRIIQPQENELILLDSAYTFRAHFADNSPLSSYIIRVWNPQAGTDRIIPNPDKSKTDSLIYVDKIFQRANIFNKQDTTIQHSFSIDTTDTYQGRIYPVVEGNYQFQVIVMNKHGYTDTARVNIKLLLP